MRAGSASTLLGAAIVVVVSTACGIGTSGSRFPRAFDDETAGSIIVSAKDLCQSDGSVKDMLERLRPWLLASRGMPTFVTVDGSPPGDLSVLASIRASTVQEVRLLRASSNVGRAVASSDGSSIVGDIIAVTTRPGARRR